MHSRSDGRRQETTNSKTILLAAMLICLTSAVVSDTIRADTIRVEPSRDATLYESANGTIANGAGQRIFAGRAGQGTLRRGLLAFDVANAIPPGATITSAAVHLQLAMTSAGPETITLHRVLADWSTGASDANGGEGGGAPAMPGDATWIHTSFDLEFWSQPGGDFVAEPSASAVVAGPAPYEWTSTPALVDDVQRWLDDPTSAHGWAVLGNETGPPSAKAFHSEDQPDPALTPFLLVDFLPQPDDGENDDEDDTESADPGNDDESDAPGIDPRNGLSRQALGLLPLGTLEARPAQQSVRPMRPYRPLRPLHRAR